MEEHGLEGGERSQDGATDPDRVLPLGRSEDLDLHDVGDEGGDLLLDTISDSGVHGGATRQDNVGIQVLHDFDIALHDGVEGGPWSRECQLKTQELRLEEGLRALEPLVADDDDLSVGMLVSLLQGGRGGSCLHFLLEVGRHSRAGGVFEHCLVHLLLVGLGVEGASVRRTGCSSGATHGSL